MRIIIHINKNNIGDQKMNTKSFNSKAAKVIELKAQEKAIKAQIKELEAEIFNGRLAMVAVTIYALSEALTQNAVVNETPFFFNSL